MRLLEKPKVIIFDESTSSLDKALNPYIADKTVITIAHRQTTIDKADKVVKLKSVGLALANEKSKRK